MAKRRSKGEAPATHKKGRRGHSKHHGKLHKFLPPRDVMVGAAAAYAYGKLEALADKDDKHYLNRAPSVIAEVGRSGNVALLAWVAGVATKQPLVKAAAAGLVSVAAYQYGRAAKPFSDTQQKFTLAGPSQRALPAGNHDEMLVERYLRQRAGSNG